jgi:hypothetical protein
LILGFPIWQERVDDGINGLYMGIQLRNNFLGTYMDARLGG